MGPRCALLLVFSINTSCRTPPETGSAPTQSTQSPLDSATAELARRRAAVHDILESYRLQSGFPGAIAGARLSDGSSFAVACGLADRETVVPMKDSDRMHAGSAGKTFFAALAMQLVAESKVRLDDPIARYLDREPWFAELPNHDMITVRMLMNHTSGLPQYPQAFMVNLAKDPARPRNPVDGIRSICNHEPLFAAGSGWSYSDLNYVVLAALEEDVLGQPVYEAIRSRLLGPLELENIVPADRAAIPGLVPGYAGEDNPFGGDRMLRDGELVLNPRFEGGGGGFVANAEDLARWMAAFCTGRAFDLKLLSEVLEAVDAPGLGGSNRYGLGVHVDDTPLGVAYGHGGYFPGYVTCMRWYPELRIAVALQVNTSDNSKIAGDMTDVVDEIASALSER